MNRLLVVGSMTIDSQIEAGKISRIRFGGVTTYGGITFSRLGIGTIVTCNLAIPYIDIAYDLFTSENVAICLIPSKVTTHFRNRLGYSGDRQQELAEIGKPIDLQHVLKHIGTVSHVHLGPLHASDIGNDIVDFLLDSKILVTTDLQGLLRSNSISTIRTVMSDNIHKVLRASKVIKADIEEMGFLEDMLGLTIDDIIRVYSIDEIIITEGEGGGFVRCAGGEHMRFPAANVDAVFDTTGAGDVFFAAYLSSRIYRREPIPVSCEKAAGFAARQVANRHIEDRFLRIN